MSPRRSDGVLAAPVVLPSCAGGRSSTFAAMSSAGRSVNVGFVAKIFSISVILSVTLSAHCCETASVGLNCRSEFKTPSRASRRSFDTRFKATSSLSTVAAYAALNSVISLFAFLTYSRAALSSTTGSANGFKR